MNRVFLDANVCFAGCVSSSGASALILRLAERGYIQVVASRFVLREAERNLRQKASQKAVQAFHRFLESTPLIVIPTPRDEVLAKYATVIHPKDVSVLAAAVETRVDYLVTLDRRHFLTQPVQSSSGQTKILIPAGFLKVFALPEV